MFSDNNNLPDFTGNFKKIFKLTSNIRKLRSAFPFSKNDTRARLDQQFVKNRTHQRQINSIIKSN